MNTFQESKYFNCKIRNMLKYELQIWIFKYHLYLYIYVLFIWGEENSPHPLLIYQKTHFFSVFSNNSRYYVLFRVVHIYGQYVLQRRIVRLRKLHEHFERLFASHFLALDFISKQYILRPKLYKCLMNIILLRVILYVSSY